jgi:hypothetical protein
MSSIMKHIIMWRKQIAAPEVALLSDPKRELPMIAIAFLLSNFVKTYRNNSTLLK